MRLQESGRKRYSITRKQLMIMKIGEAVGRLGYAREREEILECLRILKNC
jgi:hypothetical protein